MGNPAARMGDMVLQDAPHCHAYTSGRACADPRTSSSASARNYLRPAYGLDWRHPCSACDGSDRAMCVAYLCSWRARAGSGRIPDRANRWVTGGANSGYVVSPHVCGSHSEPNGKDYAAGMSNSIDWLR